MESIYKLRSTTASSGKAPMREVYDAAGILRGFATLLRPGETGRQPTVWNGSNGVSGEMDTVANSLIAEGREY